MEKRTTDELAKILWQYNCIYDPIEKADLIFVMGSQDHRVAKRGAELFLQDFAPLILFSGNVGRLTKGALNETEAETFAKEAQTLGVPKDKILLETKSTNTGENVLFTKTLLDEKNIKVKKLIVVQKPYMQRRAAATIKKLWPEVKILTTAPEISFKEYPNSLIAKDDVINILVGDTQRIKLYAEKGFLEKQQMPEEVWQAYQELVERGFTDHLIPQ